MILTILRTTELVLNTLSLLHAHVYVRLRLYFHQTMTIEKVHNF